MILVPPKTRNTDFEYQVAIVRILSNGATITLNHATNINLVRKIGISRMIDENNKFSRNISWNRPQKTEMSAARRSGTRSRPGFWEPGRGSPEKDALGSLRRRNLEAIR